MPWHSVFFQVLSSKSPKMNTQQTYDIKRKLVFPKHHFFRVHVLTFQVFWVCFASPTFWSASATISNRPRKGETLKYENRSFSGFRGFRRFLSVVVQRGELFPRRGIELYIGFSPFPVIVTTRIITFLVGNPYKPSFPLLLGRGTTQLIYFYNKH